LLDGESKMKLLETRRNWMKFGAVQFVRNDVIAFRAKDGTFLVNFNRGVPYFLVSSPNSGETWDVNANAPRFIRLTEYIKALPYKLRRNKIVMVYFSHNTHKDTIINSGQPLNYYIKKGNMQYIKTINGIKTYLWLGLNYA
jgi:hypothetical protein